jgi:hypothetical protein
MPLLVERHGRHRKVDNCEHRRAWLLRAGTARSQLHLFERRRRCRQRSKVCHHYCCAAGVAYSASPAYIYDAVTERSTTRSQSLADQWRQLVLKPLSKLDGSDTYPSYVVVLDALDECEGENYVHIILRLLAEARSLKKAAISGLLLF